MGIGNIFKIDDRYINIDRWSIIGDNCLLNVFTTGTRIPDRPFSSFGPSRDYGMDLCLEVYLWTIYPYFTTFRVTTLSFY
jgi:hypothetical protein